VPAAKVQISPEFRKAFEADTQRLMRVRLIAFLAAAGATLFAGLAYALVISLLGAQSDPLGIAPVALDAGFQRAAGLYSVGVLFAAFFAVAIGFVELPQPTIRKLARGSAIGLTLLMLLAANLVSHWSPPLGKLAGFGSVLFPILACALIPWHWKQASPLAALAGVGALVTAWSNLSSSPAQRSIEAGGIALGALAFCMLVRVGLDRSRMVDVFVRLIQEKYENVKRDLMDARRVHEAMFPEPVLDGLLRLRYRYEPMEDIGGDFLFVHRHTTADRQRLLSAVVIDVTGHGVAAALAVNRLHGELERLFARTPDIAPGDVIKAVNSYIFLLMASHGVYATGLAARFNADTRRLEYANAGHPPAYLLTHEGIISQLDSTTFMLGIMDDASFDPGNQAFDFEPGARFIAYTDGALEASDTKGQQLGLDGISNLINTGHTQYAAELDGAWSEYLIDRVKSYRDGPALDDTLFLEVSWDKNELRRRSARQAMNSEPARVSAVPEYINDDEPVQPRTRRRPPPPDPMSGSFGPPTTPAEPQD
jgi:serine phosphatase RsbU (regulator of sigma subunit)